MEKLTEHVYILPDSTKTDRPILGVVAGSRYSLAVDAGISPKHVKELREETEHLRLSSLTYAVLTHYHYDHTLGIHPLGIHTIANKKTQEFMKMYQDLKFDEDSLEQYKKSKRFTPFTINCLKQEYRGETDFQMGFADILYTDELILDLGGITCIIKEIPSPHTKDSTIVYVPEEKVLFLGDSVYGYSKNGKYIYEQESVFRFMEAIRPYDADFYVISHDPIYDREYMINFWDGVRRASDAVIGCNTKEEALALYEDKFQREPSHDEKILIEGFVNDNRKHLL